MALCTTANVKDYLGVTGSTDDTLIGTLITRAQAWMERYCNRVFEEAERTEIHNGGSRTIQLKAFPVSSIASVSTLDNSGNATAMDSTIYRVNAESGVLSRTTETDDYYFADRITGINELRSPRFPPGYQNIRVVYTGGYSTVPDDLVQACVEIAADLYRNRRLNGRMSQENIGGGASFTAKSADDLARFYGWRLDPFRRVAI